MNAEGVGKEFEQCRVKTRLVNKVCHLAEKVSIFCHLLGPGVKNPQNLDKNPKKGDKK